MRAYLDLLDDVLSNGAAKSDRTGTGTLSVFGRQARFDLRRGFPLLTTKKLHWKSVVYELLWFLRGDTNIAFLNANGVTIWDEWADDDGDLGAIYGQQWRRWRAADGGAVDQIDNLLAEIRANPDSRRLILTAWNPAEIADMRLPPCHVLSQFYVRDGELSCQLYQRSADLFLGVPFNIASYALLTHLVAFVCGLRAGDFVHTFGDLHLYQNHIGQATTQLRRAPLSPPQLRIVPLSPRAHISDFQFGDFQLSDYRPHPHITAAVSV